MTCFGCGCRRARAQAEDNLLRHGHQLLQHAPHDATTLLIDLCCGTLEQPEVDTATAESQTVAAPSRAAYLSYLSYGGSKAPPTAAATVASSTVRAPSISSNGPDSPATNRRSGIQASSASFQEPSPAPPTTRLPSPGSFFASFIDSPTEFTRFLETVAERRFGQRLDATGPPRSNSALASETDNELEQMAIWNTLLELYLAQGNESKALKLLQSSSSRIPYDTTQALVVCTAASFSSGIVHLYERLGLEEDIVRLWIDRDDAHRAVEALKKYGEGRPGLYKLVLRYLTAEAARLDKHSMSVTEVRSLIA